MEIYSEIYNKNAQMFGFRLKSVEEKLQKSQFCVEERDVKRSRRLFVMTAAEMFDRMKI